MIIVPSNVGSPIPSDPLWANVSLLVKDIGINGATNNSFYDDGPYKFLPTRNGDVTQGSFSPFSGTVGDAPPQIGGSVYFDGSGDAITAPSGSAFAFGTGDFTIECWFQLTASNAAGNSYLYYGGATPNVLVLQLYQNYVYFKIGGVTIGTSSAVLTTGVWYHVAAVRSGTNLSLYLNGALVASGTSSYNATENTCAIAGTDAASVNFPGNISNFRIVKGTAVYTAAFKPPTAPLTAVSGTSLLTCQSATAITDASSNAFTVTKYGDARAVSDSPFGYGSVYFDGSGDYLSIPSSTAVAYGTGDFTVEFWAYPTSNAGSLFVSGYNGTAVAGVNVGITNSTSLWWLFGNGSAWDFERRPTYTLSMNTWHHFAVTRESGTAKLYVDGVLVDSVANTTNFGSSAWYVGASASAGYNITGNVSNLRVVKGSAVYTGSSFAVPTAPLTAISGTSLLTCQDKGSIVDASTNSFTVSRVGDARPDRMTPFAQKQAGYWSGYFANTDLGATQYLSIPDNAALQMGTGDFTIEFWHYPTNFAMYAEQGLINKGYYSAAGGIWIEHYSGSLIVYANGSGVINTYGANTAKIVENAWNHIAVVRSGGTMKAYVNGSLVASAASTHNLNSTSPVYISGSPNTNYPFAGYMSNLRFVKGSAVYSADFTPPAAPLTAIPGTSLLTLQDNRFRDNSTNNFTVTPTGNPSVSRLNPFGPSLPAPTVNLASAGSVAFDGTASFIWSGDSTSLRMGTSDFTIEGWVNPKAGGISGTFFAKYASGAGVNGIKVEWTTTYMLGVYANATKIITATTPLNAGAWNHVAITRSGSTLNLFLNGQLINSVSNSTNFDQTYGLSIGAVDGAGTSPMTGYISNFRIVKGTSVYTNNFTPSTSPLTAITNTVLLTAQDSVTITDASGVSSAGKIGSGVKAVEDSPFKRVSTVYGGSGYFDGTEDYLVLPTVSGNMGSGDFTVEMWANLPSVSSSSQPVLWSNGSIKIYAGRTAEKYTVYFGATVITSTSSIVYGSWNHIAVVRSGTVATLYVNGVNNGTATVSGALDSTQAPWLGNDAGTYVLSPILAYISNFRIVKGVAVYTANFTPPVAPVDAVGGTSLLLNFDNAGIYDGSGNNTIQTTSIDGSANMPKVSTTLSKFGTGSVNFDNSYTNILKAQPANNFYFPGDFTVEAWINPSGTFPFISSTQMEFNLVSTGKLYLQVGGVSATSSSVVASLNQWHHVAVVRSGSAVTGYVNGTSCVSITSSTNITDGAIRIGVNPGGNSTARGYMEDLRVTKGVARYTSNFTPPTLEAATRKG